MEFGAKGQRKNKALDVFKNFKGRHAGLVKALTTGFHLFFFLFYFVIMFIFSLFNDFLFVFSWYLDVEEFFKQCDPGKDTFCIQLCFFLNFEYQWNGEKDLSL